MTPNAIYQDENPNPRSYQDKQLNRKNSNNELNSGMRSKVSQAELLEREIQ